MRDGNKRKMSSWCQMSENKIELNKVETACGRPIGTHSTSVELIYSSNEKRNKINFSYIKIQREFRHWFEHIEYTADTQYGND